MQFVTRKKKAPPAVIIISMIDILIVLLIFLMVTTTFRQQPAVRLTLPESSQPKQAGSEASITVTVAKQEPFFFVENRAVTLVKLQEELTQRARRSPQIALAIRADSGAPFGQIVKVMDAAKAAKIKSVSAFTKSGK